MRNIVKNDTVKVISGNHKGKVGKVLKVYPNTNRVVVEKVRLVKRHTKPRSQQDPAVVETAVSIAASHSVWKQLSWERFGQSQAGAFDPM